jgi:hypothetical protein
MYLNRLRRNIIHHHALAIIYPGCQFRFTCFKDVEVCINKKKRQINLEVSRPVEFPTTGQWNRILRLWPYPIDPEPIPVVIKDRYYLMASWENVSWYVSKPLVKKIRQLLPEHELIKSK